MSLHEKDMGLLPIMSPLYNLREICKQVALLEEHLNQPRKRCPDCIRKHFLTIEALFEEAVSLDKELKYGEHLEGKAQEIRNLQGVWIDTKDGQDTHEAHLMIAQALRQMRKSFAPLCFDVRKMASIKRMASLYVCCPHKRVRTAGVTRVIEKKMDGLLEDFNRGKDTLYVDWQWEIADYFGQLEGASFPPKEPTRILGLHLLSKGQELGRSDKSLYGREFFYKPEYIPMVEAIIKGLKKEMEEVKELDFHRKGVNALWWKLEGFEDQLKDLKRSRTSTKTQAEKEDEAAQKLIRKAPKKKPPRKDLRKNRVEMTDDPDLKGVGRGDEGDPDLSRRSQKMAFRVALRYLKTKG